MTTKPTADLEKYKAMVATFSVKRILEEARGLGMFYREGKIPTAELDAKTQILEDALRPTAEVSVEELEQSLENLFNEAVACIIKQIKGQITEGERKDYLNKLNQDGINKIRQALHSHTTALKAKVVEECDRILKEEQKAIAHTNLIYPSLAKEVDNTTRLAGFKRATELLKTSITNIT